MRDLKYKLANLKKSIDMMVGKIIIKKNGVSNYSTINN